MKWYYVSVVTSPDGLVEIGDWCLKNLDDYWAIKSYNERKNKAKPHKCSSLTWKEFREKIGGPFPPQGIAKILTQSEHDAVAVKLRWL